MELDADCLREARIENVERLALALGMRLPPRQGKDRQYARKLVRLVLRALADDRRKNHLAHARAALH